MSGSLIDLLQQSVRRNPASEALVCGQERLEYTEIWRRIRAVAAFLRRRGLIPGTRVALMMENSSEYVVTYYGVLAAGGTVVALNTAAKERDLRNWIEHSGASWLFGQASHPAWAVLSQAGIEMSFVQVGGTATGNVIPWEGVLSDMEALYSQPRAVEPDSPAAIIYTSGTTGQPKGVTLSHRNLSANVRSILGYLPITSGTRTLNVLPFYYSYGNSVLHTHLAAGACLVIENSLTYPHRVVERMAQEKVTGFNGVPSTYALLLARVKLEDYDLSRLCYLTQAGGAMAPAAVKRLVERFPRARVFVMYGQTEATARLSYLPPDRLDVKLGSVGIAIPGVTLQIRDEMGHVVPAGTVGDIWAYGENVMLGYWRDPQATATVLQGGWLKTGDLGHVDEEGYLYIQGRRSDMIKSGAHRINPNDVEEVIGEIEGVAEVAAVGVDDEILGQVIKAVIVPYPGSVVDARIVKAHCRDRLAVYKIPKYIEFIQQLPKTASGKVRRFELAANHQELPSA